MKITLLAIIILLYGDYSMAKSSKRKYKKRTYRKAKVSKIAKSRKVTRSSRRSKKRKNLYRTNRKMRKLGYIDESIVGTYLNQNAEIGLNHSASFVSQGMLENPHMANYQRSADISNLTEQVQDPPKWLDEKPLQFY